MVKNPSKDGLDFYDIELFIFDITEMVEYLSTQHGSRFFGDIVSIFWFFFRDKEWDHLSSIFTKPETYADFFREKVSLEHFSIGESIELDEVFESTLVFFRFFLDRRKIDRSDFLEIFSECFCDYELHKAVSRADERRVSEWRTFSSSKSLSNSVSRSHTLILPSLYDRINCLMTTLGFSPSRCVWSRNVS